MDQGFVAGKSGQVENTILLQLVNTGITLLDADIETAQRGGIDYSANALVEEDRHLDADVGLAEIVENLACGSAEEGVDDIDFASLHGSLRIAPVCCQQRHLDAGLD